MKERNVILLRRNASSLSIAEMNSIESTFPDTIITYIRTDPVDYREHAEDCRRLKPLVVILPLERPIPSAAMSEGFQHAIIGRGSALQELLPLKPEFKPFVPKEEGKLTIKDLVIPIRS